jgi:hypothetical protein
MGWDGTLWTQLEDIEPSARCKKLKIREPHVITVTGKAFYDVAHAPANHSNRRSTPKDYSVWEIHPVMALHVDH